MEPVVNSATPDPELGQFLLKEYEFLRDLRNDLIKTQESRITVYMALVGASVTALGLSATMSDKFGKDLIGVFPFVSSLLGFCILLLGSITFVRMIERAIETVIAIRGINRIRMYFVKKYRGIDQHLIMARLGPNEPLFWQTGLLTKKWAIMVGLPQIVAILNGFTAAVFVRVAVGRLANLPGSTPPPTWIWFVGGFTFVITLLLQNWWFWDRINRMPLEYDVPVESLSAAQNA
jgi:hypothetical protein